VCDPFAKAAVGHGVCFPPGTRPADAGAEASTPEAGALEASAPEASAPEAGAPEASAPEAGTSD
jgi:hypothetical protein